MKRTKVEGEVRYLHVNVLVLMSQLGSGYERGTLTRLMGMLDMTSSDCNKNTVV
jgi:hypothetical protein